MWERVYLWGHLSIRWARGSNSKASAVSPTALKECGEGVCKFGEKKRVFRL